MSDSDLDDWLDYTITHSRGRPTGAACHHLNVERRLAVARGLEPLGCEPPMSLQVARRHVDRRDPSRS